MAVTQRTEVVELVSVLLLESGGGGGGGGGSGGGGGGDGDVVGGGSDGVKLVASFDATSPRIIITYSPVTLSSTAL